jgi:hypothetical protein
MITVAAYDPDVWIRDMDSSPSPFPIPILFAFVLRRRSSSTSQPADLRPLCLPGCGCTVKLHPPIPTITPDNASDTMEIMPTSERGRSQSLRGSLVQIPRAAERRASIIVALEITS